MYNCCAIFKTFTLTDVFLCLCQKQTSCCCLMQQYVIITCNCWEKFSANVECLRLRHMHYYLEKKIFKNLTTWIHNTFNSLSDSWWVICHLKMIYMCWTTMAVAGAGRPRSTPVVQSPAPPVLKLHRCHQWDCGRMHIVAQYYEHYF